MERNEREFSETYRRLSDAEIALLYQQVDSLIDAACIALKAEIRRRGVRDSPLKLVLFALHQVAEFDRREKERRKRVLSFLLLGNPKEFLYVALALAALLAVAALLHR